jgi:hypothetical protein
MSFIDNCRLNRTVDGTDGAENWYNFISRNPEGKWDVDRPDDPSP